MTKKKKTTIWNKFVTWMIKSPQGLHIDQDIQKLKELSQDMNNDNSNNENFFIGSNKKIVMFWLIGLMMFLIGYNIIGFLNMIFIVIGTYIISIIMESVIISFSNKGVSRERSIAIAYILLCVFIILCLWFVVPLFLNQISRFLEIVSSHVTQIQELVANNSLDQVVTKISWLPEMIKNNIIQMIQSSDQNLLPVINEYLGQIIATSSKYISTIGSATFGVVAGVGNFSAQFIFFLILSILFSSEKNLVVDFIARTTGKKYYEKTKLQMHVIYKSLSLWLKHRLILSLFMFIASYIILLLLSLAGIDIPHKFAFALAIGVMDIIPYVGPFIAQIFLFIVALFDYSLGVAFVFPILIMILNLIENGVVIPILMNKSLGVSLVVTFVCMLVGGLVMGVFGIFLSVPFAVILTVLYKTSNQNFDFLQNKSKGHVFKV